MLTDVATSWKRCNCLGRYLRLTWVTLALCVHEGIQASSAGRERFVAGRAPRPLKAACEKFKPSAN